MPAAPQNWVPLFDTSMLATAQYSAFVQWVSSYFQHGDLSTRDPDVLSYVTPSIIRPPSIFNMSQAEYDSIIDIGPNPTLDLHLLGLAPSLEPVFRKATFDKALRSLLPNMKTSFVTGDLSTSFALYALFIFQNENDAAGGDFIKFEVVPGVNHFVSSYICSIDFSLKIIAKMHWDDPEKALQTYSQLIRG
jgi:hypothetical protein